MAIVAFWSDEKKETGQTMSMVALSTYMAIEHNYRILNVSTNFKDQTLEACYWNAEKTKEIQAINPGDENTLDLDSSIEGLMKVVKSNRLTPDAIPSYSRVVFNNRLDVLCSPKTLQYNSYLEIARSYPDILNAANQAYDLVFVDISKRMDDAEADRILEIADVIVVNITQRLTIIDEFYNLRENNRFFKNNNVILNIGRYDGFCKYNVKNISRYLRMKRDVIAVPYNTLFFESCVEGRVAEFFLKLRNLDIDDRNYTFLSEVSRMGQEIIFKIQEMQAMKG